MQAESRRRAYLDAMQVTSWLPRVVLPFAAPSRPELLLPVEAPSPAERPAEPLERPSASPVAPAAPARVRAERPVVSLPEPAAAPVESPPATPGPAAPVPRFALQLLRAGDCVLLVELVTGEPLQRRDPSYVLLKDLLRAAGLPSEPHLLGDGEPIRWPLSARGNLARDAAAAADYVQGVLTAQLESQQCRCLWLIGLPALRFAADAGTDDYFRECAIDGLGSAWALPGLELLIDQPELKAELWRALRRVRSRWQELPA